MKIKRKGRTYDATPTPQVLDGEGQRDNYRINPVSMSVYSKDGTLWIEGFKNSRDLMDYLDGMFKAGLRILAFKGAGEERLDPDPIYLGRVLTEYVYACRGLQSFRRDRVTWHSRADLVSLLTQVGFPPHYVTRLIPIQVQDGLGNTRRN